MYILFYNIEVFGTGKRVNISDPKSQIRCIIRFVQIHFEKVPGKDFKGKIISFANIPFYLIC